jgi:hypothetical protein
MFYVLTTAVWILLALTVTDFAILRIGKEADRSSKKPFGCC